MNQITQITQKSTYFYLLLNGDSCLNLEFGKKHHIVVYDTKYQYIRFLFQFSHEYLMVLVPTK